MCDFAGIVLVDFEEEFAARMQGGYAAVEAQRVVIGYEESGGGLVIQDGSVHGVTLAFAYIRRVADDDVAGPRGLCGWWAGGEDVPLEKMHILSVPSGIFACDIQRLGRTVACRYLPVGVVLLQCNSDTAATGTYIKHSERTFVMAVEVVHPADQFCRLGPRDEGVGRDAQPHAKPVGMAKNILNRLFFKQSLQNNFAIRNIFRIFARQNVRTREARLFHDPKGECPCFVGGIDRLQRAA